MFFDLRNNFMYATMWFLSFAGALAYSKNLKDIPE